MNFEFNYLDATVGNVTGINLATVFGVWLVGVKKHILLKITTLLKNSLLFE